MEFSHCKLAASLISLGLWTNSVWALPFTITPATSLPSSIPQSGTVYAAYTVRNNTSTPRNNNYVKWFPPHVTQETLGTNACGPTFNLGAYGTSNDSCTLYLNITGPVDVSDADPHHHLFVCFPGGKTCAGTTQGLNVSLENYSNMAIAVGQYDNGSKNSPLIYYTSNQGRSWTLPSTLPTSPGADTSDILTAASCSSNGSSCVATGYFNTTLVSGQPSSFYSHNGGQTWTTSSVLPAKLNDSSRPTSISCSSDASLCAIVGTDFTFTAIPISYTSQDGGNTWSSSTTPVPTQNGGSNTFAQGVSCGSTGLTCTAVGYYQDISSVPVTFRSTDGGNNWATTTGQPAAIGSSDNYLYGVACNSLGQSCVTVGKYNTGTEFNGLIYYTNNSGATWTSVLPTPQGSADNVLSSVACSKTLSQCIAVGTYQAGATMPLAYYSMDGGATWTASLPTPVGSVDDTLQAISCDDSGSQCIASGYYIDGATRKPLTYLTLDGGKNWTSSTPTPVTAGFDNSLSGVAGGGS